jgi:hypothetical protein
MFFVVFQSSNKSMSVVAQNSSTDDQSVELDFTKSRNVTINHPHQKFSIHLPKSSVVFIAHMIKTDPKAEFLPKVSVRSNI